MTKILGGGRVAVWAALLILSTGALAACGDDDDTPPDGDAAVDGGGTDSEVTPDGSPDTGTRRDGSSDADTPRTGCAMLGEACVPGSLSVDLSLVCFDQGGGEGVCLQWCIDGCDEGFLCLPRDEGAGACLPSQCDGFFTDDCAAGAQCVPLTDDTNFCFPTGGGGAGDACDRHTDCGAGMLCIGGSCDEPDCTPNSDDLPCGDGQICAGYIFGSDSVDVGQCFPSCNPFAADGGGCAEGESCGLLSRDGASGPLRGACFEREAPGAALEGDECTDAVRCAAGLSCSDSLCVPMAALGEDCSDDLGCTAGLICVDGLCEQLCDPENIDCGVGQACPPAFRTVRGFDFGFCTEPCTPYQADPVGGCSEGNWCLPLARSGDEGLCTPVGAGTDEAECSAQGDCAAGLMCQAVSSTTALCLGACEPGAAPDSPGDICTDGNACNPDVRDGDPLSYGLCGRACDVDDSPDCGATGSCLPGELVGTQLDICGQAVTELDDYASCDQDFTFCGTLSACLEVGDEGLLCTPTCRFTVGDPGTSDHPDCPANTVCITIVEGSPWGACLPTS